MFNLDFKCFNICLIQICKFNYYVKTKFLFNDSFKSFCFRIFYIKTVTLYTFFSLKIVKVWLFFDFFEERAQSEMRTVCLSKYISCALDTFFICENFMHSYSKHPNYMNFYNCSKFRVTKWLHIKFTSKSGKP